MISIFRGRDLPNIKCWVPLDREYRNVSFPCKPEDMNAVICTNNPKPWRNGRVVEVVIPPDAIVVPCKFGVDLNDELGMIDQRISVTYILVEKYTLLDNYIDCEIINQDYRNIIYNIDFTIENAKSFHGQSFKAYFTDDFPFTNKKYNAITSINKYCIYPIDNYRWSGKKNVVDIYEVCIPDDTIVISGVIAKEPSLIVSGFDVIRRLPLDLKSENSNDIINNVAN